MGRHDDALGIMRQQLVQSGFVFEHATQMRGLIERYGSLADWAAFAASWNDLALDPYLVDAGRFRRRRHAVFSIDERGVLRREPHQPLELHRLAQEPLLLHRQLLPGHGGDQQRL